MGNKKHIYSNGMVFFLCSDSSTDSNLFPWEFSNAHLWRPASHTSPQPFIIGKENSTTDSKKYFPKITAYLAPSLPLADRIRRLGIPFYPPSSVRLGQGPSLEISALGNVHTFGSWNQEERLTKTGSISEEKLLPSLQQELIKLELYPQQC